MVDRRTLERSEARKRRAESAWTVLEESRTALARITNVIRVAKMIVGDETFICLAQAQGIATFPQLFEVSDDSESTKGHFGDCSLDFAVVWRFFHPLLSNGAFVSMMDTNWPGFTLELRDIFILLVADGPFPKTVTGRPRRSA